MAPPIGKYQVPVAERFWAKVNKTETCWEWTAALNAPEGTRSGGYGVIGTSNRRTAPAHRVSWEMAYGPIPEGMSVLHHCDNRKCVRPDHLFVGTQRENVRDMLDKGRQRNQFKFRTTCKYGHEYTTENTRVYAGRRWCRQCAKERARRVRAAA